ncbi:methyl-accepting chemotaxis protein [Undibacterium terreum]|uniref:Methyl-accepting chemotaxis protein n=1 Tax=Undibacterium terreum TaxID=1224302 RepID=A0A916UZ73_9BURK|nr:methyl-accepting chemotaxis protein [Undibacterium terreum]GGC94069.1 methyl-accepting chemotaxis protein [Undibacterium terreum]
MKLFYDLKISAKLFTGFIALLLLTTFLGVFSIIQLARVNNSTFDLGTNWMPSVNAAMGIKERISRIRTQEMQIVLSDNEEDINKYLGRFKDYVGELKKYESEYAALISEPAEKKLFAEYTSLWEAYAAENGKLVALAKEGKPKEARDILRGESSRLNGEMLKRMDNIVKVNVDGGVAAYRLGEDIYANSRTMIIGVLVVSIALGMVLAYFIARVVARPLQQALRVAQTVASGDLTSHIVSDSKDETGQLLDALKEMNASLLRVVSEVRTGTDMINTASSEIASGNMDLSTRTETQASSLEETASSMEELTSTVRQNGDNAKQANQLSHSASEVAQKGGSVVSQVVQTMGSINESSKKIVDIIGVIDGIAFQTNILALNAAVEAARAGEQGRGFAVVASEVRNLAQRSASAAKEIKQLINDSVEQVDLGTRLVDQAGITMDEVVASVRRVTDIISEITAASQEQSTGIEQINDAIVQMDQVTQQNAALVEQAAAAAGALQEQASNLSRVVGVFKLSDAHLASTLAPAVKPSNTSTAIKRPAVTQAVAKSAKPTTSATQRIPAKAAAPKAPVRKAMTTPGTDDWEEF